MSETEAILVVEHDRDLARAVQDSLQRDGYVVRLARTAAEARRALRDPVAVLVLDLGLPDTDPLALLREAAGLPMAPDVIVTTPQASIDSAIVAIDCGAAGYLVKPYAVSRLDELVARVVERRGLVRENERLNTELANRLVEAESLLAVASTIGSTLDLSEALRRICRELVRLTEADTAAAYLFDAAQELLVPTAAYRAPKEYLDLLGSSTIPLREQGFYLPLWTTRRPVHSEDVTRDPRFSHALFREIPPPERAGVAARPRRRGRRRVLPGVVEGAPDLRRPRAGRPGAGQWPGGAPPAEQPALRARGARPAAARDPAHRRPAPGRGPRDGPDPRAHRRGGDPAAGRGWRRDPPRRGRRPRAERPDRVAGRRHGQHSGQGRAQPERAGPRHRRAGGRGGPHRRLGRRPHLSRRRPRSGAARVPRSPAARPRPDHRRPEPLHRRPPALRRRGGLAAGGVRRPRLAGDREGPAPAGGRGGTSPPRPAVRGRALNADLLGPGGAAAGLRAGRRRGGRLRPGAGLPDDARRDRAGAGHGPRRERRAGAAPAAADASPLVPTSRRSTAGSCRPSSPTRTWNGCRRGIPRSSRTRRSAPGGSWWRHSSWATG